MEFINSLLGTPLGYIMHWCYDLLSDYGWAIILFTVLTKVIIFPLSIIAQKNSIKMVRMQPLLEDIKSINAGNGDLIVEEQKALYKREKYSTLKGILPLLVQIPLILGLINVIYNPLKHLLRMNEGVINEFLIRTAEVLKIPHHELGYGGQIRALEAVQNDPSAFESIPDSAEYINQIMSIDVTFFGFDLAEIPSFASITILIPVFSGLSALLLCLVQNKYNVLQVEQGFIGKWGMAIFLVAFSAYFAFVLPGGLGLYWIAGNVLSIPVLALCNLIYSPKKYIDYENRTIKKKLSPEEKKKIKSDEKILHSRSLYDSKRFYAEDNNRELVFYSESNGFYKYFAGFIDYILENSDTVIHYVTSDPNDSIFDNDNPKIKSYFIGDKALIGFMMKMDADIVVMTLPDLDRYHIKRSLVRKDVEYIYLDHGMTSLHLMLREGALDHFDTIFCYGPNQIEEVRETEKAYDLPHKTLVKSGYGLLDVLIEKVEQLPDVENEKKKILIAPSWQRENIMDSCLDEILSSLLGKGYDIIVRPHPEYVKRFKDKMDNIIEKYADKDVTIETDFSSNESVYQSDIIITDWSSVAQEFSYSTKKPSIFINTPMKIMNPNYKKIPAVPLDISLRDEIGVSIDMDKIESTIANVVADMIENKAAYKEKITEVLNENIFDIGHSSVTGGNYIIDRIKDNERVKKERAEMRKVLYKNKKGKETAV